MQTPHPPPDGFTVANRDGAVVKVGRAEPDSIQWRRDVSVWILGLHHWWTIDAQFLDAPVCLGRGIFRPRIHPLRISPNLGDSNHLVCKFSAGFVTRCAV